MWLGFGRLGGLLAPCGMHTDHLVMCCPHLFVDAAWDSLKGEGGYRVGVFSPCLGMRVEWLGMNLSLGRRSGQRTHQSHLWDVWTTVKLACHLGWQGVALFLDSAGVIYHGVQGRALVGLWVQQWLLRRINVWLFRRPLVVHFVFVQSFLQPAGPLLQFEAGGGSRAVAADTA